MPAAAIKLLTLSVVATAALTQHRAVNALGAVPAAGGRSAGFADVSGAIGERVPYGALGTTIAEAGAAFAADVALEVDAAGRVVTKGSGVAVARALEAASGAGVKVEVLLIPN